MSPSRGVDQAPRRKLFRNEIHSPNTFVASHVLCLKNWPMGWQTSNIIRLVHWVNALLRSFLQRCWIMVTLDRSADVVCSVKPIPFGPSSPRYWMPIAVARKWCARYKPWRPVDYCHHPQLPLPPIARHVPNFPSVIWKISCHAPPTPCMTRAARNDGKIDG